MACAVKILFMCTYGIQNSTRSSVCIFVCANSRTESFVQELLKGRPEAVQIFEMLKSQGIL